MIKTYTYQPLQFFSITFSISWAIWFCAIYASFQPSMHALLLPLVFSGLGAPAIGTFIMLFKAKNSKLWNDFIQRLQVKSITKKFIPIVFLLFPTLIVCAIIISLLFGEPINQLYIFTPSSDLLLQGKNFLFTILVLCLIGPFEEIGWRGYAIDSLRAKFNLLQTSLFFGAIWGLWHIPLFFIKNSGLQQQIWNAGLLQTFIYFTGLFLITIVTNWLYIKNNRSILIAILFHSVYDICLTIFHITPLTWFILWVLLLTTALIIINQNKKLFY